MGGVKGYVVERQFAVLQYVENAFGYLFPVRAAEVEEGNAERVGLVLHLPAAGMEAHKVACLLCLVVKVRVFVPFFLLVGFLLVPHKGLHAVGAVIVNDFMGDDKSQLRLVLQLCHKSRIDEYHALGGGESIDNGAGDGVET